MNPNQCFIYYMIHWQGYSIHGQLYMHVYQFCFFNLFIIVKKTNTHSLFYIKVSYVAEQQQGTKINRYKYKNIITISKDDSKF